MIPESYMPTLRQRQHRRLVRHRQYLRSRQTSVRCRIRSILADYNADRKDLFSTNCGPAYFGSSLSDADQFVIKQMWANSRNIRPAGGSDQKIKTFAAEALSGKPRPGRSSRRRWSGIRNG